MREGKIPTGLVIVGGLGLGLVGALGIVALALAARVGFSFSIVNPPAGGNYWQLLLANEVWGDSVIVDTKVPIADPITLESLPPGWRFPLYIRILIYESVEVPHNIVYRIQSAYGPDWPHYKDITIPGYGEYQFDCATGNLFEV